MAAQSLDRTCPGFYSIAGRLKSRMCASALNIRLFSSGRILPDHLNETYFAMVPILTTPETIFSPPGRGESIRRL